MVSIIILIESNNIVRGFASRVKVDELPHNEMMKYELGRMNECKQVAWANGEISNFDFTIIHSSIGGSPLPYSRSSSIFCIVAASGFSISLNI
jgi:hypothetical protein